MQQADRLRISSKSLEEQILRSPISILPDDILRYLFTFTIDPKYGAHQFTIRITHVCRLWRQIALDSAVLWTKVRTTSNLSILQTFLGRSKDAPLEIDIFLRPKSWDRLSAIVDLLLPRIAQLKALSLTCRSAEMHYFLQHITADPSNQENTCIHDIHATNLESLKLHALTGREVLTEDIGKWFDQPLLKNITSLTLSGQADDSIPSIIPRCPQLRELYLNARLPSRSPLAIPTLRKFTLGGPSPFEYLAPTCLTSQTWDGIVELILFNYGMSVTLDILTRTPRLERATLNASWLLPLRNSFTSPFVTATLKSLVFLDIIFPKRPDVAQGSNVLQYIQTPVLKDLRLELGPAFTVPTVIDSLARTHFPLKHLSLRGPQFTANQLYLVLASLPSLEELSVNGAPEVDVEILQVFNNHPELCTRLWALNIEPCDPSTRQELDTFLRRRRQYIHVY